ncbi:MAG: thiamine phosphate synthase [Rhodobacterales bacterium]|nr:thiamine phosphate synthase [Rhodobacterales bacterium]
MSDKEIPQIYLITPANADLSFYTETLAPLLDICPVACIRLGLSSDNESLISRHADQLREVAHARDISAVMTTHYRLVNSLGLDGVHRLDAAKTIREIREELGTEAIVGSYCGTSRHVGMNAGEIGADYISFGPVDHSALTDENIAEFATFEWWSEMVEIPVVAEGNVTLELAAQLAPVIDFLALGQEIWKTDTPLNELQEYLLRVSK